MVRWLMRLLCLVVMAAERSGQGREQRKKSIRALIEEYTYSLDVKEAVTCIEELSAAEAYAEVSLGVLCRCYMRLAGLIG